MIGIGKWQGSVNIQILKFSGDVFITIADNNGNYDVDIKLPQQLEKVSSDLKLLKRFQQTALRVKVSSSPLQAENWHLRLL